MFDVLGYEYVRGAYAHVMPLTPPPPPPQPNWPRRNKRLKQKGKNDDKVTIEDTYVLYHKEGEEEKTLY